MEDFPVSFDEIRAGYLHQAQCPSIRVRVCSVQGTLQFGRKRMLQWRMGGHEIRFFKNKKGIVVGRDAIGRVYRWNAAWRQFRRVGIDLVKAPWKLREGEIELDFCTAYSTMVAYDDARFCNAHESWKDDQARGVSYAEWTYFYNLPKSESWVDEDTGALLKNDYLNPELVP